MQTLTHVPRLLLVFKYNRRLNSSSGQTLIARCLFRAIACCSGNVMRIVFYAVLCYCALQCW